ncbi:MAG: MMPL family transporter [Rhodospirillaceae bacterium]|nr:MMPL family transporter [Rhodospirillaceae bacterium]
MAAAPASPSLSLPRLAEAMARHHPIVIGLWVLLAAASVWLAATRLGIDTGTEEMIDPEVPFRRDSIAFNQAFPALDEVLLVVIDAPTPEEADAAAAALAGRLEPQTDLFGAIAVPAADPFFHRNGLLYLDTETLTAMSDRIAEAQPLLISLADDPTLGGLFDVLIEAAEAAGGDAAMPVGSGLPAFFDTVSEQVAAVTIGLPGQMSWRRLMAGDATSLVRTRAFILAHPAVDTASLALARNAIAAVRAAAIDLGLAEQGITVRLTGEPALKTAELATVSKGAALAGVLSFILVALLLVWGLGSARLIAAVLATLVVGLLVTAGFATVAVGALNLISVAFAVLFVGLAVDFGIHVALRCREVAEAGANGQAGAARAPTIADAVAGVGPALALASVCAAVGFLSFAPTAYRGLAELGVISAGGMAVALVANLTLMPALLAALKAVRPAKRRPLSGSFYARATVGAGRPILAVAAATTVAAAVLAPFVGFDVNPLNLQDPGLEAVSTYRDLASDPATSPYSAQVLVADREAAAALAERLRAVPEVGRVLSIASFLPEDQERRLEIIDTMALFLTPLLLPPTGDPPSATSIDDLQAALAAARPDDPDLAAAFARLDDALTAFQTHFAGDPAALERLSDRLVGTLPAWLGDFALALQPDPPQSIDDLPASLRERWIGTGGQFRVEATPAVDVSASSAMREFAAAVLAVADDATGPPVVLSRASDTVIGAFYEATGLTLFGILVVLIAVQRRLDDIVMTLLPLGIAALWTLAVAVVLGLSFNLANVIVLPLLFGLGVASSIHLVTRRRQVRAGGTSVVDTATPRAVLFSALTTIASFGSLAVSPHRGMSSMGELLTIAIIAVLLATLVVLPCLMAELDARRAGKPDKKTRI